MKKLLFMLMLLSLSAIRLFAQGGNIKSADSVMVTVFLKHQKDKNLDSLQAIQKRNKFSELFPIKSARVVSWYVMMGIGQVVTLKIPAGDLRALNVSVEKGAWGAFDTDFYPTYDFVPIWKSSFNNKP